MAPSVNKRRKLTHESPSAEDSDGSFASFGSSASEEGENATGIGARVSIANDRNEIPFGQENTTVKSAKAKEERILEDNSADDSANGESEDGEMPTNSGVARKASRQPQVSSKQKPHSRRPVDVSSAVYHAGMSKSNTFKLRTDELLNQIRPKIGKRESSAAEALHQLRHAIESIPARSPLLVEQAERQLLKEKVTIPFPNPKPPKDAKYRLEYVKPANINVVGGHVLKTTTRSKDTLEIDMVVIMPSSLFQEKDYLNHRYFYKRSYYLACLAAGLKASLGDEFDIRYRDCHDISLKPIITIDRSHKSMGNSGHRASSDWIINILPCIGESTLPKEKLFLDKNCVRPPNFSDSPGQIPIERPEPTPFYNSSIRADMVVTSYLKLFNSVANTCTSFRDASLLGKTWLRQRGLEKGTSKGGFGGFEWTALMALLLHERAAGRRPILSEGYSSYQLFKSTIQFIASQDLSKQPLTIGADVEVKPLAGEDPVIWDGVRGHNLLFKMTPWSFKVLHGEAQTTANLLNDQLFEGFEETFIMRTTNPLYRFDYLFEIEQSSDKAGDIAAEDMNSMVPDRLLYNVLRRALGDRVALIQLTRESSPQWDINFARPRGLRRNVTLGFVVSPEAVDRKIDHGPSAENKVDVASFRSFWGTKAELRRFKDGSISETLVWSTKPGDQTILEQIIRFALAKHCDVTDSNSSVKVFAGRFNNLLPTGESAGSFQPLMEGFRRLELDIRSPAELPLSIKQIMPADAQLRYSSIRSPATQNGLVPANVTIQFESSSRWPEDLVAIQKTKIAFLLKLGELLEDNVKALTTRVGLENEFHGLLNQAHLDVIYDSGAAFRIRIQHEREPAILQNKLKDKTIDSRSKEVAARGLAAYKRNFVKSPKHTQTIARLCGHYKYLSGTIRLLKKWFASHLLENHIAEEVIEMLAAQTFVKPWPWRTPSSVQTGFLRTLVRISRWDWRAEPLVVDLSPSGGELKQAELQSIDGNFEAWRKIDPALNRVVLFAASSVDPDGTTWTDGRPAKVAAGRMTALALAAVAEGDETSLMMDSSSLFASSLQDFDFVIHLNSSFTGNKRVGTGNGRAFKNLEIDHLDDTASIGFDPAADFLEEIQNIYSSSILFFSSLKERSVIAGLWDPHTASRPWNPNISYSTIPRKRTHEGDVRADVNKKAILLEIAKLGGDLVRSVDVSGI